MHPHCLLSHFSDHIFSAHPLNFNRILFSSLSISLRPIWLWALIVHWICPFSTQSGAVFSAVCPLILLPAHITSGPITTHSHFEVHRWLLHVMKANSSPHNYWKSVVLISGAINCSTRFLLAFFALAFLPQRYWSFYQVTLRWFVIWTDMFLLHLIKRVHHLGSMILHVTILPAYFSSNDLGFIIWWPW